MAVRPLKASRSGHKELLPSTSLRGRHGLRSAEEQQTLADFSAARAGKCQRRAVSPRLAQGRAQDPPSPAGQHICPTAPWAWSSACRGAVLETSLRQQRG